MDLNPRELLVSAEVLGLIERISMKRFSEDHLAHECYSYILSQLEKDDCNRIRKFRGESKLTTFLHTVINKLAIDFVRHKFGRKRFPKPVSNLGTFAEHVFDLVCWKEFSYEEAFAIISCNGGFPGSYQDFLRKTDPIRDIPCNKKEKEKTFSGFDIDAVSLEDAEVDEANPLELLLENLEDEKRIRAVRVLKAEIQSLSEEDRILFKLRFESDLSYEKASKVLGISVAKVKRRLNKMMIRLKKALLKEGITGL